MELKNVCGVWYVLYRHNVGKNKRCFWPSKDKNHAIALALFDVMGMNA